MRGPCTENLGTGDRCGEALARCAALLWGALLACACPAPAAPPPPTAVGAEAQPAARPAERAPSGEQGSPSAHAAAAGAAGTLGPEARAALHQRCTDAGCPEGLACLEYCGVAGCRPGSVLRSCELRCSRAAPCPEGLTCANVADGPGQVCSASGDRPPTRAPAGAEER